jgi:DNA recombination protein Rad52
MARIVGRKEENMGTNVQVIEERLKVKLDPSVVKYREQAGRQLAYIEGYTAINNANQAFGYLGWSSEVGELKQVHLGFDENRKKWVCVYTALVTVRVHDPETGHVYNTHSDVGTGQGVMSSVSDAVESAIKEAVTDALKRTLRHWGPQFGLDLYSEDERQAQGFDKASKSKGFTTAKSEPAKPQQSVAPQQTNGETKTLLDSLMQVYQGITDPDKKGQATKLLADFARKAGVDKLSKVQDPAILKEALDALYAML